MVDLFKEPASPLRCPECGRILDNFDLVYFTDGLTPVGCDKCTDGYDLLSIPAGSAYMNYLLEVA